MCNLKGMMLLCTLLLSASVAMAAEEITVGGGGASIATIIKPINRPFEKATGMTLITMQSTPKNGLIDLVNGAIDVATAAVPLDGMIKGAEKDGVKIDPATLEVKVVAKNYTVLFVNPSNKVDKLSKEQIKGIFTGKITNWKDVGGSNTPIVVVWGKLSPGQNALFTKTILDGEPVSKDVAETTDYAGIKEVVAETPEAIGIDPRAMGAGDASVRTIDIDPAVVSDIIVITKAKPAAKVQKLLSFINGDGRKYIK